MRETPHGYLATEEHDNCLHSKCVNGKRFRMVHWLDKEAFAPGFSVDHIDFDPKNNTRQNLRDIPMLINCMRKKATTGDDWVHFRGVTKHRHPDKFRAKYSKTTIGTFPKFTEAAVAYNIVLHHVLRERGYLNWYNEVANPLSCDAQTFQRLLKVIPEHVFASALHGRCMSGRSGGATRVKRQGMYSDFWQTSTLVELHKVGPGCFAVERTAKFERPSVCVSCSVPLLCKRNEMWDQAPAEFYKCPKCLHK